jgi:hypothetical protein
MALLSSAGANYIPVRNLQSATAWYIEKFALRRIEIERDDSEGCVALGFTKDEYAFTLGPLGKSSGELSPMLCASNLKKAHALLLSRGIPAGEIQQDRQGTHYFTVRDLEDNEIEIYEEP